MTKPGIGIRAVVEDELVNVMSLSLRDWFAGQALIGLALSMNAETRRRYRDNTADGREALMAYTMADQMLAVRGAK